MKVVPLKYVKDLIVVRLSATSSDMVAVTSGTRYLLQMIFIFLKMMVVYHLSLVLLATPPTLIIRKYLVNNLIFSLTKARLVFGVIQVLHSGPTVWI